MHRNNIIHRDIKPENLVLDSRGYIRITDLGIARVFRQNNSSDTSGTPGYMSPEVICRQNHSFVSDFFALGVIAYELMTGKRPYNGKTRNQIRQNMLAKQAQIKSSQLPHDWSYQAADFINRLLQRKPENRLGFQSIQQIKNHPWIRTINWDRLATKQIESPFIPLMKKKNFDQDQQITIEDEQQAAMIQKNSLLLRKPEFQQLFKDYYFDQNENQLTAKEIKKNPLFNLIKGNEGYNAGSGNNYIHSQGIFGSGTEQYNQQQKQSKKKLKIEKQPQKQKSYQKSSIPSSSKLAGKKYSEQLNLKKSSNPYINNTTTTGISQSVQKQSSLRLKKTVNDISDLNKYSAINKDSQTFLLKGCQFIQSHNNSDIIQQHQQPSISALGIVGGLKQKRKFSNNQTHSNSNNVPKQGLKTFFKEFKY